MKRSLFLVGFLFCLMSVFSQNVSKGAFSWGITAGAGMADMRMEKKLVDKDPIANIQAGVVVDYAIVDNFFLESGLTFQRKGYHVESESDFNSALGSMSTNIDRTVNLFYLQLPVLFNYRFNIGQTVGLIPQVGPYFAVGVGGKTKIETEIENEPANGYETVTYDVKKEDSFNDQRSRFDLGLRFALGVGIASNMKVSVGYDLGLVDWIKKEYKAFDKVYQVENNKSKNGSLFATFTYYFNQSKGKTVEGSATSAPEIVTE